jgi:flagellar biosynthesis protein FlhA
MPSRSGFGLRDGISRHLSLIIPVLIVGAVLVLVAPLPPLLLDVLLAANITLSVVILLTAIHVAKPLDFSVFPAVLLGTTLLRLVLNVASTRLILSRAAEEGTLAAGQVIASFGDFVAAGSPTVGLILFVIMVTIQFLVITRGASRIGEVAARFALDGMPGRQMAVDADLASGVITQEQAHARRLEITQQADFYGSMDGASRFVRGDALAALVITCINIVGGLFVGIVQQGMSLTEASAVFTTLTIGDGLVSQLPALLISLAAGLIVTRSSVDSNLPRDAVGQLLRYPAAMFVAAGFLFVLAMTGLPAVPLTALGIFCCGMGWMLSSPHSATEAPAGPETAETMPPVPPRPPRLHVEPLELELGIGLLNLVDAETGGDLLERITQLRNRIAGQLGFLLPKVRIRDNLELDPRRFRIKLRGAPVAIHEAYADALFAVQGDAGERVLGIDATEPGSSHPAVWIKPSQRDAAVRLGSRVHAPQVYVIKALEVVVRRFAHELLTRQHVHALLNDLRERAPDLVTELESSSLTIAQVHQVLANLLEEGLPIRDLETILEALGNHSSGTANIIQLTELVRRALTRTICHEYCDTDGVLHALRLSPGVESLLSAHQQFGPTGIRVPIPAPVAAEIEKQVRARTSRLSEVGRRPVLLCQPDVRAALRKITQNAFPELTILSTDELSPGIDVAVHATVSVDTDVLEPEHNAPDEPGSPVVASPRAVPV